MSNLIFSLNATMPIFLTMILGLFFRKVGILDESFTSKMNKFVFKIALPVLLFQTCRILISPLCGISNSFCSASLQHCSQFLRYGDFPIS